MNQAEQCLIYQRTRAEAAEALLRTRRQMAILLYDALRHEPRGDLREQKVQAVVQCLRLLIDEPVEDDLVRCDAVLVGAGLDALPDVPD